MGKAAKAHRAKVEKRNRRIAQERYAMQNSLNKLMKQMAEQKDNESLEQQLNVSVGGNETPFSVIDDVELNSIVEFKENNQEMFQVEEPQVEDQISELEK